MKHNFIILFIFLISFLSLKSQIVEDTIKRPDSNYFNRVDSNVYKQGVWRAYYDNGSIESDTPYYNDTINGIYRSYHKIRTAA